MAPEVLNKLDWNLLDQIIESGEADNTFNERKYKWFLQKYKAYKEERKK